MGRPAPGSRRLLRALVFLALIAVPMAAVAGQNDQTTAAPVQNVALTQSGQSTTTIDTPLAVLWKFTGEAVALNHAAPIVTDDSVYLSAGRRVYAVDLNTGGLRWRYPELDPLPALVTGSPVYSNGVLYFGAGDGLYALNAADGKEVWTPFRLTRSGVYTSPKLVGNNIYFAADNGRFYGIDARTGKLLGGAWGSPSQPGIPIGGDIVSDFAIDENNTMYYITAEQVMHAIDLATGVQKWAQRLDMDVTSARPVVVGDTIYLAASNTLSAYRARSGYRVWAIPLPNEAATPPAVSADGTSYVPTTDGYIYAINSRGRGVWRQAPRLANEIMAQPLIAGNDLVVGTARGGVYVFNLATGGLKWNYSVIPSSVNAQEVPIDANVAAHPVAAAGTLYVVTDDGTMTAFRHDAPDTLAPEITVVEPLEGEHANGFPPFTISARIVDEGSGLNLDTLSFKVDDTTIPRQRGQLGDVLDPNLKPGYTYTSESGNVSYSTQESGAGTEMVGLSDGIHRATITVSDWMGNQATKTWLFYIDNSLPRRAPKSNQQNNGNNSGKFGGFGGPGGPGGPGGGGVGGGGNGGNQAP
ncbi:MAG TPA: PQQ-binding-like beta-propeller repeat protein [Chthonomonadaceae bacterium]|nr:PQQ-binding-like beta-propeller repeat protein [Chthonomonadaceae bacterium]